MKENKPAEQPAPTGSKPVKNPLEGIAEIPATSYVSADIDTGEQHVVTPSKLVLDHPDIIIEEDDL